MPQVLLQLVLRSHVGLDFFVFMKYLAGGKDSWIIIEKVGINMVPKPYERKQEKG